VLPHVHVSLAFLLCVSLVPEVMRSIEQYVPWVLNTLGKPGVKFARVEAENFLAPENGTGAYLPEDFSNARTSLVSTIPSRRLLWRGLSH
jgi:hypothetical protein